MPTGPGPSLLQDRIRLAWQTAVSFGQIDDSPEDFAAAIDAEAGDGRQFLVAAPVSKWLDGSFAPSFRTMMAIARLARYDEPATRRFLYGAEAGAYSLRKEDWLRFVDRLTNP